MNEKENNFEENFSKCYSVAKRYHKAVPIDVVAVLILN